MRLEKVWQCSFYGEPTDNVDTRGKALFVTTSAQKNDEDILKLIEKRSNLNTESSVYKKK